MHRRDLRPPDRSDDNTTSLPGLKSDSEETMVDETTPPSSRGGMMSQHGPLFKTQEVSRNVDFPPQRTVTIEFYPRDRKVIQR